MEVYVKSIYFIAAFSNVSLTSISARLISWPKRNESLKKNKILTEKYFEILNDYSFFWASFWWYMKKYFILSTNCVGIKSNQIKLNKTIKHLV